MADEVQNDENSPAPDGNGSTEIPPGHGEGSGEDGVSGPITSGDPDEPDAV